MSHPRRPARPQAVLVPTEAGGLEIRQLWRYLGVAGLVAGCAMLSAWSRVDLVETSVALDRAQADLDSAFAERERLELELAALTDPQQLVPTATALSLQPAAAVVDLRSSTGTVEN